MRIKEKRPKGKIVLKKIGQSEKNGIKKTASPGVEPGLFTRASNSLDHYTIVTHVN